MPMGAVSVDALPKKNVDALRALYGEPAGKFFRGKDGITCYRVAEPSEQQLGGKRARVAVVTHGIGTESGVYAPEINNALVACGFRVLSYDYYAHGWSHADEGILWDRETMQTQLFDLLDHVLAPGEPVDLFVGHSTGGVLGVCAAVAGRRQFRQMALISPAFWKVAPLIVKLADKIPSVAKALGRFKPLKLVENGYLENADNSFAHEGNRYFYPRAQHLAKEKIKKKFALHPQIVDGVAGIISDLLRADLLAGDAIPAFKELVASQNAPQIGLFWGSHDIVVPVEHAQDILSWPGAKNCVIFNKLDNMGHDSILEDAKPVAREIAKFVSAPASAL